MGYVYAALWLVVGMVLVFKMGRENKAFYAVGGFFFFWAVWQLLGEILNVNMYDGAFGWIHKGIGVLTLALCIFIIYTERKKSLESSADSSDKSDDDCE